MSESPPDVSQGARPGAPPDRPARESAEEAPDEAAAGPQDGPPDPAALVEVERRRQHPLGPLLRLQGLGQALVAGVVAGGSSGGGPWRLLTLVPVLLLFAFRVVEWATTTYEVAGGALRVDSGVLTRRRREVPLDRVQQVDVKRGLRHRLFRLGQVTVDAAGGSGGEVTLVVSDGEVARLRGALASGPAAPAAASAGPAEWSEEAGVAGSPAPLVRLRAGPLALAGVTGAKQLVMLAVLGSTAQLLDDVPIGIRNGLADRVPDGTGWLVAAALLAPFVWCALAAAAQLATDLGFTLTSDGTVLQVRRGFPTQREASLALDRVQMVRIDQTVARRALGLVSVQVVAAGSGATADAQVSRLTVPILPVAGVDRLLAAVLPAGHVLRVLWGGAEPGPVLVPAPPAARRRQIVRRAVPVAAAAGIAAFALWPWGLLAALLVPLAGAGGELAYRGLGHVSTSTHLVARQGGLWRRAVVVPYGRTQSSAVRQTLFQRRAGLATLDVDIAGRGNRALVVDLPCEVAYRLAGEATTAAVARADERARRRG